MMRLLVQSTAILLLLAIFAGVVFMLPKHKWGPVSVPVRSFIANIDENGQYDLVGQMSNFAKENNFSVDVSQVTPDKRDIVIGLTRKNLSVIATNPWKRKEFLISINQDVGTTTPEDKIDVLATSLKNFVPELADDPKFHPPANTAVQN